MTVTDDCGNTDSASVDVAIGDRSQDITFDSNVPDACQGQEYPGASWTALGGPCGDPEERTYTWTLTDGTLPPGLNLSGADSKTVKLRGFPSDDGDFTFTLTVEIENEMDPPVSMQASVTATIHVTKFEITTDSQLPYGCVDSDYALSFQLSCGDANLWTADGDVPPGMTVSDDGVLSGVPGLEGDYTFTVTATAPDYMTTDTKSFSIHIGDAIYLTSTGLGPCVQTCSPIEAQLLASGGMPPYTFEIVDGRLPPGVLLDGATGLIAGTPTRAGNYAFTVRVTDAYGIKSDDPCGPGNATFLIVVNEPLVIATPATLPDAEIEDSYQLTFTATGGNGSPVRWSATNIPPGMTFDAASATLRGTPTTPAYATFTVTACDSCNCDTQACLLPIYPNIPRITTTTLPPASYGQPWTAVLEADGACHPTPGMCTHMRA